MKGEIFMNKLFTKIAAAGLSLAMAVGVGVAVGSNAKTSKQVEAAVGSLVYTLDGTITGSGNAYGSAHTVTQSNVSWSVTGNIEQNPWRIGGKGISNTDRAIYSTTALSDNIAKIEVNSGATASSLTVNSLTITVHSSSSDASSGSNAVATKTVTSGVASSTVEFEKSDSTSWAGKYFRIVYNVTRTGTSGNGYITFNYAKFYKEAEPSKTVTSLEVLDENANELSDGDEVNLTGSGETATTDLTCGVTYSTGDPDGLVDITSDPSANFSVTTEDDETYTLTFAANGDYDVTIAAQLDDNFAITVTYHVSGITEIVYEKVTSASSLKAGSQILVGKSDGTYVLGKYASGNNCPALSVTPTDADNIPASALPTGYALLTLSGTVGSWTLTDQDSKIYYGTSGANKLQANTTSEDTWTISIDGSGVASMHSNATEDNRYLRKNSGSELFACYTSAQHGISIYMIPSNDPAIEVAITGSTSLAVGGTATLTASKVHGATGTITWSKNNNHVTLSDTTGDSITVTGATDGSTDVTASLTGGSTVAPVVTTFTVTKALSSIAVTTAPTKTTYTEGESFDNTGMVVTATYDDASTETPNDYTWSPSGALTPSDTTITISWGGKSTTQAITVNAKVVSSIAVQSGPTKNSYHAGDEFDSTGLTIRVTYSDSTTSDITSGFTISPDSYIFTSADETAGSKTFTVTYSGKTTNFSVTVSAITGPIPSGRYYIMTSDKAYGLNAVAATGSSPTALSLSSANQLTAFDFELVADNEYKVTVTISETLYYLACTATAASGSNTSIRVNTTSTTATWHLDNSDVETAGAYHFYTIPGSVNRYLSCYNTTDWRGYASLSYGDPEIQFVAEGSYAEAIAYSLMNDITCDDGVHAPSTSVWGDISDAYGEITIAHEKTILTEGSGDQESEDLIEQALGRYDYIVGKYNKGQGITAYNDFLGRDPSQVGITNNVLLAVRSNSSNITAIIVIVSLVSLTAIGGYFAIRKRKEQ